MDPPVEKMMLTKFGFRFNLLGSSSFLSVLGVVVSIIGVIGSIGCFVKGGILGSGRSGRELGGLASIIYYVTGAVILIIMIPYLIMWILLKIKTSKQDVTSIEKIGKIYSYVSGSLEIIAMIARIIISSYNLHVLAAFGTYSGSEIVYIIGAAIYFVFAFLKVHGVRVENNKLVGTYLGFRYGLFVLNVIAFIIIWAKSRILNFYVMAVPIYFIIYFILDIGLTVILHSIRVNRENTAGTENAMKNF